MKANASEQKSVLNMGGEKIKKGDIAFLKTHNIFPCGRMERYYGSIVEN